MPITPGMLASLRARANTRLMDTCLIEKVVETQTAQGKTKVWSTRQSGVQCRLTVMQGRELVRDQQIKGEAFCTIVLPANTTVAGTDRITVTKSETGEVFVVQVTSVLARSQEITRRVLGLNITVS